MHLVEPLRPLSPEREPAHLLAQTRAAWGGRGDLWVFGYASLIWRPEFESIEQRPARVHGWHRALEMRSRINRGTPEFPGLVFALVGGGSCQGMVYRIARDRVEDELPRLWAREMPNSVYDPRWLACRTAHGDVSALAFTLSRASPNYTGPMDDAHLVQVLKRASGRYGTTLAYLLETANALNTHGIRDKKIERLVALARQHALVP
ncbi:MAG: gamma-glutamylcyclotransferase [Rhizobacter sp.]|nr:gamma-glutamylcyclotransferase [Rhizobacter sp.]